MPPVLTRSRAVRRLDSHNQSPGRTTDKERNKEKDKNKNKDKRKDKNKNKNQHQEETEMEELRRLREEVAQYKAADEQRRQQGGIQQQLQLVNQPQLQVETQHQVGDQQQQGENQPQRQHNNQPPAATQQQQQGEDGLQQHQPPGLSQEDAAALMAKGVVNQFSGVGVSSNVSTSSILPTVSGDIKRKIWANQYISLETLLRQDEHEPEGGKMLLVFDPTNPSNPMSLSKKRPPKIASWQQWIEAYQVLMFVMLENKPGRARELVGYQCLIMDAATKFPLQAWLKYDEKIRKSTAENPSKRWDQIDVELWVVCFTLPPRALCSVCQSPNHWVKECPAKAMNSKSVPNMFRPRQGRGNPGFCFGFNSPQGCSRSVCHFKHKCSHCEGMGHGRHNCSGVTSRATSKTGTHYSN
ncbi:uncharacterized protein [Branchiostoma lanceolatum]|uniref:uncharacterized protein n=1 Tax=Branchiostoma lanceolatum TaxID=7740 RepID=UPI00345215F0